MSDLHDNTDVAVLGGGLGGYVAALVAAQRGAQVVLIEKKRLICEARSGRILGVQLVRPHGTDPIAEGALAVQTGATADNPAWTTHAHLTLPEAIWRRRSAFAMPRFAFMLDNQRRRYA